MKSNPWLENHARPLLLRPLRRRRPRRPASTRAASRRRSPPTSAPISTATSTIPPTWPRPSGAPTSRADGDLRRYLDFRNGVVTSLVAEIRAAVRTDADVAVIPSVARPTGGAWYEGSDLGALAETAGIIEACFYEPSAMRVKADLFDIRRRLQRHGQAARHPAPVASRSRRPRASSSRRSRRCATAASTNSPSTTGAICAGPTSPGSATH